MRKLTLAATVFALFMFTDMNLGKLHAPTFMAPSQALAEEPAEDPEITSQAKLHFKLGQEAYAAGKYDLAIKELKRAYVLKRIPAILMNIAMTYRKTKDYEMALYFYRKFMTEAPPEDKMRAKVETEISEVEQERTLASQPQQLEPSKPAVEMAKPATAAASPAAGAAPAKAPGTAGQPAAAGAAPATATAAAPTTSPAAGTAAGPKTAAATPEAPAADQPVTEWTHTPIDAVPPSKPVDVRVQMPVMKGVKVKVFFRKEGQATFDSIELKRRGNEKVARLPETVSTGRTFQYYVEARDGAGTVVKSSGSEFSPNIVLIDESARPQLVDVTGIAEGNDEDEPARRIKAGPKRDIENEAVRFDIGSNQQAKAMEKLRAELKSKDKKPLLRPLGWAGVGVAALGAAAMATGGAFLGLAARDAAIVSADSRCENEKNKCLFFGPNDDPALNKAPADPSSAYERRGMMYDKVGIAMMAAGGVVLAAGGGLLAYDLIRKRMADRPAAPAAPKKRKVKKVVEVEEPVTSLFPMVGPNGVGFAAELSF